MSKNPPDEPPIRAMPPRPGVALAYCPDDHKKIATFDQYGLLVFCKQCKSEQLISWSEMDRIRARFQRA